MNQLFPHRKGESMAVSNDLISITHKIELVPNQEAKAHFRKAFGCARLAIIGDWPNGKTIINRELKNRISI